MRWKSLAEWHQYHAPLVLFCADWSAKVVHWNFLENRRGAGLQETDPLALFKQTVQAELDARRADWALSLDQLAQYTDSLEKELIKMASNMRRSRTEILHLSVRWANRHLWSECVCVCVRPCAPTGPGVCYGG